MLKRGFGEGPQMDERIELEAVKYREEGEGINLEELEIDGKRVRVVERQSYRPTFRIIFLRLRMEEESCRPVLCRESHSGYDNIGSYVLEDGDEKRYSALIRDYREGKKWELELKKLSKLMKIEWVD